MNPHLPLRWKLPQNCFMDITTIKSNMHRHPTIDTQYLTGDIASLRRAQEVDGRRHVFRCAKTTHRRYIEHEFALLLRQYRGEFGGDEARRNRVGRNVATCH